MSALRADDTIRSTLKIRHAHWSHLTHPQTETNSALGRFLECRLSLITFSHSVEPRVKRCERSASSDPGRERFGTLRPEFVQPDIKFEERVVDGESGS
mmetsp:Transcript_30201/g.70359  ORF Transcript_30201/g.70359 Transcript_30201/m.70359 type:complete len:98 (+) Transcript_30201:298-591(+)